MRTLFFALAALFCGLVQAATVFKCVDASGKVTFTQNQNCPDQTNQTAVVRAHNPEPTGEIVQMAPTGQEQQGGYGYGESSPRSVGAKVTGLGGKASNEGCSTGLTETELRTAKVRGEIVQGMSRQDVESIYGTPNENGATRGAGSTTYWNDKYVSQTTVSYDSGGCVRSTYQSGRKLK